MGNKLFVGNLSFSVDSAALEALFAQAASVQSVKVIVDRDTGRSKGFAFVEVASSDEAQACIEKFHGYNLNGRPLNVSEAREQAPRGDRGPRRDAGGPRFR